MTTSPRAWISLCCGSAPVAALLADEKGCPPVSTQGSKRGFAAAILDALGLAPGQGAGRYVLNDCGIWGLAQSLMSDPGRCAEAVRLIRSMDSLLDGFELRPTLPGLSLRSMERAGRWPPTHRSVWEQLSEAVPFTAEADGAVLLATWLILQKGNFNNKPVELIDGRWRVDGYATVSEAAKELGWRERWLPGPLSKRLADWAAIDWGQGLQVHEEPAQAMPGVLDGLFGGDLTDCVVYIDPDYEGTTRFLHSLPRAELLTLAAELELRGATVVISEAEALPQWGERPVDALELTRYRTGQHRVASRQQREFITANVPLQVPGAARGQLSLLQTAPARRG